MWVQPHVVGFMWSHRCLPSSTRPDQTESSRSGWLVGRKLPCQMQYGWCKNFPTGNYRQLHIASTLSINYTHLHNLEVPGSASDKRVVALSKAQYAGRYHQVCPSSTSEPPEKLSSENSQSAQRHKPWMFSLYLRVCPVVSLPFASVLQAYRKPQLAMQTHIHSLRSTPNVISNGTLGIWSDRKISFEPYKSAQTARLCRFPPVN